MGQPHKLLYFRSHPEFVIAFQSGRSGLGAVTTKKGGKLCCGAASDRGSHSFLSLPSPRGHTIHLVIRHLLRTHTLGQLSSTAFSLLIKATTETK